MELPDFNTELWRAYKNGIEQPRLAHVIGQTAARKVAIFSQLLPGIAVPSFVVLHKEHDAPPDSLADFDFVGGSNASWTPEWLRLELSQTTNIYIPSDHENYPVRVNGLPVTLEPEPQIPVHQLPPTEAELMALLAEQGYRALE